jgi:hypothetical protein
VLGLALWLALATWRLDSVPGMSMDEAWSILSARGEWPAKNPLSGMTSYAGPFPVLLLRLFGTANGVLVLRGASVLASAVVLISMGMLLRRLHPERHHSIWALPLVATLPVWLIVLRTGIEVVMFMPILYVVGLYSLSRKTPASAFVGGLSWGLLVYNHLIGICFPIAAALAWWVAYRRWPPLALRPAIVGGLLGLAPRIIAVLSFHDPLEGSAARYSLWGAVKDLPWLPLSLWRAWQGDAVFLRYVGRLALEPWPYWLLGAVFILPWAKRLVSMPQQVRFTLLMGSFSAVLITLAAPYIAVRFLVLPISCLTFGLVLSGCAAIERDARWSWPIKTTAFAIAALNLFYCINDFYRPWQSDTLGYTKFFFGHRAKRTGNWAYYPKEDLVRDLLNLDPSPEQVIAGPALERPLRVLLDGSSIRVTQPADADPDARSLYIDYREEPEAPHCIRRAERERCFANPTPIGRYFNIYR